MLLYDVSVYSATSIIQISFIGIATYTASMAIASSPGLLKGEGRPGIHCMCMRCYYSDSE